MHNSVLLSRRAEKFLAAVGEAGLYRRLREAIDELEQNSRPSGCVKLTGAPNLYRVRVGDYRIVYQATDARRQVLILSIGHRRDVYRG
ncbi:MAG TPA: type II toxin-antitoxin system RelE/ParE family toxin [Chthoniobacterales bacterium]|jgi:mRNA interferase RelE/StbE